MNDKVYELIIIGGGPAGLGAAYGAYQNGLRDILIIERDKELGGILNQCIHNGFGLHYFKEELTGPEYAERFIKKLDDMEIEILLDTTALEITKEREVHIVGKDYGYKVLKAKSIVLAMGCRERTRGAIGIPGTRPSGIFTAGAAQRYVNMDGYMVGRRVLILGSGDIGLIMARRLSLEGAEVLACVELMPYSGGLTRNIVQCLHDYNIPLYLSHTVTEIRGEGRLREVVVSKVDEHRMPILGTEMIFECDTLLLSVGLIPENELSKNAGICIDERTNGAVVRENMETSIPGVFACGNVLHVHDLVDFVSEESEHAGKSAAAFVKAESVSAANEVSVVNDTGVSYTVPQIINTTNSEDNVCIFFRVNRIFGKSKVILTSSGLQIAAYSQEHMTPGEMERIVLPRQLLVHVSDEIVISCEEVTK